MNMTLEEAKLYHYRLWDEVMYEIPYNMDKKLYIIKDNAFNELRSKRLVPKEEPDGCCYLCEYYGKCRICPLAGCDLYFALVKALNEKDVDRAVSLAKAIRDIYETNNNENKEG